jgi:hypothetical protein
VSLFGLIPGAKKLKKKLEADLSAQVGHPVVLPTPSNANVLLGAATGALATTSVALQLVPGLGTGVGLALGAAAKATAALQAGDTQGAAFAAFGALAPVLGDYAAETFAPAVGDVLTTANAIEKLRKGVAVSAAAVLPGLSSLVGENLNTDGLRVLADKVLAAKGLGGELGAKATAILAETNGLAAAGNANAKAALGMITEVSARRAKLKLAAGVEQAITASGAVSLAAQVESAAVAVTLSLASDLDAARFVKGEAAKNWGGYWDAIRLAKEQAEAAAAKAAAEAAAAQAAAAWEANEAAREKKIIAALKAEEHAKYLAGLVVQAQVDERRRKIAALKVEGLPTIPRVLEPGIVGYDVVTWQRIVNASGRAVVEETGEFSAETAMGTRAWQKQGKLQATGVVDESVLRAGGQSTEGLLKIWQAYRAREAAAAAAGAAAGAAAATAAAATAATAAAVAPAAVALIGGLGAVVPQAGFVVTAAARILEGIRWVEDPRGVEGVLVLTTGPAALRRDATVRRWVAV